MNNKKSSKTKKTGMTKSEVAKLREEVHRELQMLKGKNPPKQKQKSRRPKLTAGTVHVEPFCEQFPVAVNGSTGLSVGTIAINPGDASVFPRLCTLASLYAEWRFKRFSVRWIPLGSAFAANSQTGEIVISAYTNFSSAKSADISSARSRLPGKTGNAWAPFTLQIPMEAGFGVWRKLRSFQGSSGMDPNETDFIVEVAAYETPNTNQVGFLEWSGEVEMRQSYNQNLTNAPSTSRVFCAKQTTTQTLTSTVETRLSLASAVFNANALITGAALQTGGTNSILVAGGTYLITASANITATNMTSAKIRIENGGGLAFSTALAGYQFAGTSGANEVVVACHGVITVAEDVTGSFGIDATVVGSGTITVVAWNLTVVSL